ncbi:MAG: helicase-related protein, partial [Cyanobacteria bacterium J06627_32]
VIVVSHVLNEGVDVPDARVAILLSGSGSTREYVQRLGRVLRKGSDGKVALLYEVIAEQTSEEGVSRRRRQSPQREKVDQVRQLTLVPDTAQRKKGGRRPGSPKERSPYQPIQQNKDATPKAAEDEQPWPKR